MQYCGESIGTSLIYPTSSLESFLLIFNALRSIDKTTKRVNTENDKILLITRVCHYYFDRYFGINSRLVNCRKLEQLCDGFLSCREEYYSSIINFEYLYLFCVQLLTQTYRTYVQTITVICKLELSRRSLRKYFMLIISTFFCENSLVIILSKFLQKKMNGVIDK